MAAGVVQCLLGCLVFTAEVAALTVQAAPGSMPFEAARSQGTLTLTASVPNMEEAVKMLDTSPMSCVSFDALKGFAHFRVRPEDHYDQRRARRQNTTNLVCRAVRPTPATLMVPTYLGHQALYTRLVESVKKFVTSRTTLVNIFSSVEESVWMTGNCSACATTLLLEMRALVFDYSYEHFKHSKKFNYQTSKKLWGLNHVEYDNVLMLDSDFSFLRPIVLEEVLAPYEHVIYEGPLSQNVLFPGMMQRLSERFNSTMLDYAPFEMPWIYNKRMVSQLIDQLGPRYVEHILYEHELVFEVFVYRVFVLAHDPAFFSKHIPTTKVWFDDPGVAESERLAIDPPPISVRHSLQQKQPCQICWLEAHADRD